MHVLVLAADESGVLSKTPGPRRIGQAALAPRATSQVTMWANLQSDAEVLASAFNPALTARVVYDTLAAIQVHDVAPSCGEAFYHHPSVGGGERTVDRNTKDRTLLRFAQRSRNIRPDGATRTLQR
jgi:hypothetical protein